MTNSQLRRAISRAALAIPVAIFVIGTRGPDLRRRRNLPVPSRHLEREDRPDRKRLPPFPGDSVGTANAINDKGQVVGISGVCDQAVGRESARYAVLWENGTVTDIGNLGADTWNTPVAINQHGDVVGFAGVLNDQGVVLEFGAFFWTKQSGIRPLGTLGDDTHSEAWAINARRQVVGVSCGAVCSGFLWQDDVLMDPMPSSSRAIPATFVRPATSTIVG